MEQLTVVGRSIPRIDGEDKVTGHTVFGADLKLPGMLYGKVLRSPLPHAKIIHVDTRMNSRNSNQQKKYWDNGPWLDCTR
jgi:CO/xanthine dehydrogenase Mo-binding subunit